MPSTMRAGFVVDRVIAVTFYSAGGQRGREEREARGGT